MSNTMEKAKILLIDDDEIHLAIANEMLKDEYEISTVQSGKKALDLFAKGYVPNIILLDVMMPDMSGWETLSRIKAISFLYNTPIVFVTSLHGTCEEENARKMGAADFISKPLERDILIKKIEELISKESTTPP